MLRRDGIAEPALDFDPDYEGMQYLRTRNAALLGERKKWRSNWGAGVDHGPKMRIVEFEEIGTDGVHKRRIEYIEAFGPPDNGCVWRTRKRKKDIYSRLHRRLVRRAQGCSDNIKHRALRLMPDGGRNVLPSRPVAEVAPDLYDRAIRVFNLQASHHRLAVPSRLYRALVRHKDRQQVSRLPQAR